MRLVAAELLKLRRWSTWVLLAIAALFHILVGYVLLYAFAQIPTEGPEGGVMREALLQTLGPEALVGNALSTLASLGGALALVIGALLSAREYGWRTIANLLIQGPTRLDVFAAKAGALAIVVVLMVLLTFLAGIAGVAFVAAQSGGGLAGFPGPADLAIGAGVGCLIVGAWAALGYALGYLLRSTGLAIGLGLVYALVIESIISGLGFLNETFEAVSRAMIGINGSALAASFGPELPPEFGVAQISAPIAAAVLAAYLAGALAIGALVFARRDVT